MSKSIDQSHHADYQQRTFAYQPCTEQEQAADKKTRHPVIIVGAGPSGLSAAIDIAQRGIPVVVVDDDNRLSNGSRAICFAKRTLDIFDRLGCAEPMVEKGVRWNVGRVFLQDQQVYQFDLLPETGHRRPAFINLQQYYVEGMLLERAQQLPNLEIRWKNRVTGLTRHGTDQGVTLTIETPDGAYDLHGRYIVAADGSRSAVRKLMCLDSKGRTFKDRFLIADVKMKADFPAERWFWFDPPFHRNQSVLLHSQPDNVWRIDFQLGWDADPELEKQPERVIPRVRALLGKEAEFTLEWVSVYTFSCLRMDSFRHGAVLFIGDAAHGVSPFGARGANSGVQDAENLAWKLALVLQGNAPDSLLDSYASEREYAADENILNSTRSTDFITPKSDVSHLFRDAVLKLAQHHPFARQLVNSGRLSVPAVLKTSHLNSPDVDATWSGNMVPGAVCADVPIKIAGKDSWLLSAIGQKFTGLFFCDDAQHLVQQISNLRLNTASIQALKLIVIVNRENLAAVGQAAHALLTQSDQLIIIEDYEGLAKQRYAARPGSFYLVRPDQHVCGRWRELNVAAIKTALQKALGLADKQHVMH
ncbi:FAD-dependent oxidoreductase [Collimonas antrihumi]|uniref:FAD-dependent oxidoreductase n=1 Tax=Collimonas antrihumi TaxID=1940615 RepID=UPI001B8C15B2|nr:FAD-dependent oxidoreductase [Collimonas antrihumi]